MIEKSEKLKRGFEAIVRVAPQILDEEDLHELQSQTLLLASNFDTISSHLRNFGRIGVSGKKFAPTNKIH